jgi:hypothetical protein
VTGLELLGAALISFAALAFEARGGALPADLLAAAAIALAARPGGSLVPAAALGAARDAVSGGRPGPFLAGYLAAALFGLAALGRARRPGLFASAAVVFLGTLAAHTIATLSARAALVAALATATGSPAALVPLAALEALARGRDRA